MCNDRTANPIVHLHSCVQEVLTFDARLDLLCIHITTSPQSWLWDNQAGVWGQGGPCAVCWQAAEDIHRCIYRCWRQLMSLNLVGQADKIYPVFSVWCCLMPPTMVTQASELSRSTPVFQFHWYTGLVLVQTKSRMPTRTRQAHGAKFRKTPNSCFF